jgi:UDP-2,4-diacetamido-2,4,6-trideoxy-beta-L-altropyranose hydrolase
MRCLTLAQAARANGLSVSFVCREDPLIDWVETQGFDLTRLDPQTTVAADAAATAKAAAGASWLVWDHYGLDAGWVAAVRALAGDTLRVLAIDDLDAAPLGSDLVLDQTRLGNPRRHHEAGDMIGPRFALLRPEFAALRDRALRRPRSDVRRILVMPGMMDAAGLAPAALDALDRISGIEAEVVMSSASQSRSAVETRVAERPDRTLTLDARDIAERLATADFCIGAGGMTTWERCCLGVPTLIIVVADNQAGVAEAVARAGAACRVSLDTMQDPDRLAGVLKAAFADSAAMSHAAAGLCDGLGTQRVLDALRARLRPLTHGDAERLYRWRLRPEIRAVSHTSGIFSWKSHLDWIERTLQRSDGLWRIYEEGAPRGFVSAVETDGGTWRWSFYIGDPASAPGAGGRMLKAMLREIWACTDAVVVEGEVLADNVASAALHRRLGFVEVDPARDGVLVFRLERRQDSAVPKGQAS